MARITLPNGKQLVTMDEESIVQRLGKTLSSDTIDGRYAAEQEGFWALGDQHNGGTKSSFATYHERHIVTDADIKAVQAEHQRLLKVDLGVANRYAENVLEPLQQTERSLTRWYVKDA